MPTGNLPASGKKLFEEVYQKALKGSCKDAKEPQACAAGSAWTAVKNAGWKKDADGKWHKSSNIEEQYLTIKKAYIDPKTGEKRWRADTSNTSNDLAGDNMTLELFSDFVSRINADELAPEEYRSDFWEGGMPYLSVSHYTDLDGEAVPGVVDAVYVDGSYLKAKGRMFDTKLGSACWKSICDDLEKIKRGEAVDDKVRVSIGFLDYGHTHKSNGFVFDRKSLDDTCPECLREIIDGEYAGRAFYKGLLVHLAMTRVPMNRDTTIDPDLEVTRSMTTRKEDAASIIGEELADELDEKAKLVGKSEALIVKSEEEDIIVEEAKTKDKKDEEEVSDNKDEEDMEDEDHKKKKMMKSETEKSDGEYVVYKPLGGATSMKEAKQVVEAQKEQWRVQDLWWTFQDVMSNILSSEDLEDKSKAIKVALDEFKTMLSEKSLATISQFFMSQSDFVPVKSAHVLDEAFEAFKSRYDEVYNSDAPSGDKLQMIQEPFNQLGGYLVSTLKATAQTEEVAKSDSTGMDMVKAFSEALQPLAQKLDLLIQQNKPVTNPVNVPQRRSFDPALIQQAQVTYSNKPLTVQQLAEKSVGLS